MDWVMCLLSFAVCFMGFLAAAKVTKKKKWILAAAGVVLFLAAAFGSLAVYRNTADGQPIFLENLFLPYEPYKNLMSENLNDVSMFDTIERISLL